MTDSKCVTEKQTRKHNKLAKKKQQINQIQLEDTEFVLILVCSFYFVMLVLNLGNSLYRVNVGIHTPDKTRLTQLQLIQRETLTNV